MTRHARTGSSSTLKALAAALMLGAAAGLVVPALAEDAAPAAPADAASPAAPADAAPAAPAPDAPAAQPAAPTAPAAPAAPQQPDPNAVVATVGGEDITEADVTYAGDDLQQQMQQMPQEQQRAFLVSVLIDMKVMAQAARAAGLDQSQAFKSRLGYLSDRELRGAFFADQIAGMVTQDAVQAAYDKYVAGFKPEEQVHARHILVATKEEADQVEADLKAGKPFELEAMAKTTDPSGKQNGGDLGYFTREQMVKPFADAAFALEAGQVSDPVQSQFGWHVIKVEDKKMSAPQPFEQLAQQLSQEVLFQTFDKVVGDLKANAAVTIPDPTLAAEVKSQNEAQAAAEEAPAEEAPAPDAPATNAPAEAAPAQ